MNLLLKLDPNRIHIFHELKKRRIYVGELIHDQNRDIYELRYDKNYLNSKQAIPLGPDLDLFKTVHTSKKGQLFPTFLDRIPEKSNPAYRDYCFSQGISPDEKNPMILLSSIGARGPSSFVFERVYEDSFSANDIINMRKELDITQHDLATAFDIKKITLQRIEAGLGSDQNTIKLLQIYFSFPDVALWQLKQTGSKIHSSVLTKLIHHFEFHKKINHEIEKLFLDEDLNEIDKKINEQFKIIQNRWNLLTTNSEGAERQMKIYEIFEKELSSLLLIGFFSVKYNEHKTLKKILNQLGPIASFGSKNSSTIDQSISFKLIYNFYHYLGIYALKELNAEAVHLLLKHEFEIKRKDDNRNRLRRIWTYPKYFEYDAYKIFYELYENFPTNDFIKEQLGIDKKEFLSFLCQFNMLCCLKWCVEIGKGENPLGSVSPNFGRFEAYHVLILIKKINNREEYKRFIEKVMDEKINTFINKFPDRINGTSEKNGLKFLLTEANHNWNSVVKWDK